MSFSQRSQIHKCLHDNQKKPPISLICNIMPTHLHPTATPHKGTTNKIPSRPITYRSESLSGAWMFVLMRDTNHWKILSYRVLAKASLEYTACGVNINILPTR